MKPANADKGRRDGRERNARSSDGAPHLHVIEGGRQGDTGGHSTVSTVREGTYAPRRRRPWFRVVLLLVTILVIVGMVLSYV